MVAGIRSQVKNHATAAVGEIIGTAMFLFIVSTSFNCQLSDEG